jgi:hypothetical protein
MDANRDEEALPLFGACTTSAVLPGIDRSVYRAGGGLKELVKWDRTDTTNKPAPHRPAALEWTTCLTVQTRRRQEMRDKNLGHPS